MMGERNEGVVLPKIGVAALLACGLFPTIGLFSPGLVLPQIERAFIDTPNVKLLTELVGTLAGFAFAMGAPIAGALIARLGCRRVLLPALLLFAVAGAAPALLQDLWSILAARLVLGFALSGVFTSALAGIGALPEGLKMRLFGLFSVVGGATAIILFPLIGAIGHFGWQPAFLVNLMALAAVPLAMTLPRTLGMAAPQDAAIQQNAARDRGLLNAAMIGLLVLAAMAGMGMLIGPIYAPLYLVQLGISDTRLFAVPATCGSIAAVCASALYGRMHAVLGIRGLWAVAMLAMGAALVLAGISTSMMLFTVAVVANSAMVALMAPNVSASAVAFSPPHLAAQAIGLANGVMFGAQLAFPLLAAWLRSVAGLGGVFLLFGALVGLIGAGIAFGMVLARRQVAEPVSS